MIVQLMFSMLFTGSAANAYQLETRWRSEAGAVVTLDANKGAPVLLSFIYTGCGATCPLTTKSLQRIEKAAQRAGKKVSVVVVSLDPKSDTPAAVAAYRERYGLTGKRNWQVLVGDEAMLRKLTMLLDFRYSANAETGAIMHDNKIFVLSASGDVVVTANSLAEAHAEVIAAL